MNRNLILPLGAGILVFGIVAYAFFHNAQLPVFHPQGPVASAERDIIVLTTLLSAIVVLPVFGLLAYLGVRYRASNTKVEDRHAPDWDHDSVYAEFFWWTVPTVIIFFLGMLAVQSSKTLDPYVPVQGKNSPMVIQVQALDWKWLFIYPAQGIATVNMLEIPKDTPIDFVITSKGPMNSFWIPSLGGQIMAMPGMTTHMNLLASNVGTFQGSSANISGRGFSSMNFAVHAVSSNDFNLWVASVKNDTHPLMPEVYRTLVLPSTNMPAITYSDVASELYTTSTMSNTMQTMQGSPVMKGMTP
jgi:cytochrome o ubiquinol oxidase subunit 2